MDLDPDFNLLVKRIVEAALMAAPQPQSLTQLSALFPDDQPVPPSEIKQAIDDLREDCAGRGVELVEVASGYRFQVKADVHPYVARLWTERQTKYTRATLETLALIAYRQPITRGEIEQIRGVGVNANMIKMLEEREWIRSVGHRDVPGRPELFGTTRTFLDYFGLKSLDELPPLAELKDIPELEPQLPFDIAPPGVAAAAMIDFDAIDFSADADIDSDHDESAGHEADASSETGMENSNDESATDSNPHPTADRIVETTTADTNEQAGDTAAPELRK
ncbi:SMC-Scp complex subunit ScpB [Arenimonas sp.]|uniref:SMC-Scp complex subunit ScpB n=1 Tax=Arenimonas sp. TaxID=1872635 RepID=UPI0039C89FEE